ncbi:endonuclease/exonuclease/phosphatase family protein [Carboxylicivirga sp. N1Y90]|uniref:endonuclease/exonuclease/phosphatase family protein n=1 Tax=Carboxylicivirga fragile TaxID=3417571 RepID=UPI003D34F6AC|nr:endonuclease/exonuclease/phosphatase family protein [Marinilabiliaceae bacterium N1Y90]
MLNKRISFVLFVSIIALSGLGANGQTYKAGIVAFYNLENLFDTIDTPDVRDTEFTPEGSNKWTGERYWRKISMMADVISDIGADEGIGAPAVVGLCEMENRMVIEDLVNDPKLKPYNYQIVHYDSPDERGVDVCMIYQPKYFQVTNSKSLPLIIYKEEVDERLYTRDQLLVSGIFDGEPMHFIVNHWPSRSGGEMRSRPMRNEAAKLSRSIIDSIQAKDKKAKVILMGDLNDDPINESVAVHLNAVGDKDELGKENLFNTMDVLYRNGIGTLAYRDKWNLFDQIIVTPSLVGKKYSSYQFKSAHIYNRKKLLVPDGRYKGYPYRTYVGRTSYRGGYSDHFPVYIILIKAI